MEDGIAKKPKEGSGETQRWAKAKSVCHLRQEEWRERQDCQYEEIEPLRWSWCCTDPSRGTDRGENFPGSLILPTLLSLSNWSHGSFSELSWKSAHMGAWRDQLSSCPVNSSKGLKNKSEENWVMGWPESTDLLKVEKYYLLQTWAKWTSYLKASQINS